ncbi:N-acetyltransferase [Streptomyces sp. NPDC098781]|uniref:N-acetyltransferase n=1 Tax=Streptomyces sp. NPDC098781 TaxID=3366097 RepID=UPI003817ADC9
MPYKVFSIAERPDFSQQLNFENDWPEFILYDPVDSAFFGRLPQVFPEFTVVAVDDHEEVVARGYSVPFLMNTPTRGTLPDRGWDEALLWAFSDQGQGIDSDTECAIGVTVRRDHQGRGLSKIMLEAMRQRAFVRGFSELVVPVRPTGKLNEPRTPMSEYVYRTRSDGLPCDPWLRTHVRAGGVIDSIAPASMVVTGSLSQWRKWTGRPFDSDGWVDVPGGLVPARCVMDSDYAVYVEPNVWVRHRLTDEIGEMIA